MTMGSFAAAAACNTFSKRAIVRADNYSSPTSFIACSKLRMRNARYTRHFATLTPNFRRL